MGILDLVLQPSAEQAVESSTSYLPTRPNVAGTATAYPTVEEKLH